MTVVRGVYRVSAEYREGTMVLNIRYLLVCALIAGCAGGQVKEEAGPGAYQKPAFE